MQGAFSKLKTVMNKYLTRRKGVDARKVDDTLLLCSMNLIILSILF